MPDFDISGILSRGLEQRQKYLGQPMGWSTALPVIGNVTNDLIQKKMQLQAQQEYANFLAMSPDQRSNPQNAVQGYKAALALGINPPVPRQSSDQMITDPQALARLGYSAPVNMAAAKVAGKAQKQSYQELSQQENDAINKALEDGRLSPSQIIRGPKLKALASQFIKNPGYNASQADVKFGAEKTGASAASRLEEAGPPQVLARYAQSTKEVLKVAEDASKNFPRFNEQFLNTPYIKLKSQSSPEALQWTQIIADLRGHVAAVLAKGYAPQQQQIDEAARYIPDSITPKQLTADIPLLNKLIDIQTQGMMTRVVPSGKSTSTPSASTAPSTDSLQSAIDKL